MALVVITIRDNDEGTVDITCLSEPGFPGPASDATDTPAQATAGAMLDALSQ